MAGSEYKYSKNACVRCSAKHIKCDDKAACDNCLKKSFFLVGEADKTRRYTVETMLEELDVMTEGQVDKNEVPKL
nr:6172_t:CDS:2 [Entrophospora candida]